MSDLIERYRAAPSSMLAVEVADEMVNEIERLTAEIKHAKEMERVWMANAKALADVANRAEARADVMAAALLKCTMNHDEAHYIAQTALDTIAATEQECE